MQKFYPLLRTPCGVLVLMIFLLPSATLFAQSGPTAAELSADMTVGWNLGNSLEVPTGETDWGNPATTKRLIDSVAAAGFNVLRIPTAWNSYADPNTLVIDPAWLARVKEVVDYGRANEMYVILNSHWDGGWLEEKPFYADQESVNAKQKAYWTQIANYFADYDEHLLFAGTNEVRADYNNPTDEYIEVQQSYLQTFVDAVRATGGNNLDRSLIVQTYNTNIWHGLEHFTLPTDVVADRLFVEVHSYDPYNYTLNPNISEACTVWGTPWAEGDVCDWGQEDYHDDLFARVKAEWVDEGVPVILGEFGVVRRSSLTGQERADHLASRAYYLDYIVSEARENGIVPVYWDNGWAGDNGFALFDRTTGASVDQGAVDALTADLLSANPFVPTNQIADYGILTGANPFSGTTQLTIGRPEAVRDLRVLDIYGREMPVAAYRTGSATVMIGETYPRGTYIVLLNGERGRQSIPLIKQ
ncbi:cellulase family glycosylhydrolase [Lewinella sp. IMCC34191]|uniref:cellulase family glycosylhydrolase n=1 Tax=Lewinella sp. IMCC34191 TaxID=2259172 RepID=UPI0013002BB1|nr:cellulase family glycosylhydrolase [Lewinella sp. IMCC34191]